MWSKQGCAKETKCTFTGGNYQKSEFSNVERFTTEQNFSILCGVK